MFDTLDFNHLYIKREAFTRKKKKKNFPKVLCLKRCQAVIIIAVCSRGSSHVRAAFESNDPSNLLLLVAPHFLFKLKHKQWQVDHI